LTSKTNKQRSQQTDKCRLSHVLISSVYGWNLKSANCCRQRQPLGTIHESVQFQDIVEF